MSWPAGRPSISAFTAKSLSGSASSDTERITFLKLSLVAMSKRQARRPVGARPHHAGIDRGVAGLQPVGEARPVGGAAERGPRDAAGEAQRGRGGGGREQAAPAHRGDADRHGGLLVWNCIRRCAAAADSAPTVKRQPVTVDNSSMIPKKPAPHLMRGGNRFSEEDHAQTQSTPRPGGSTGRRARPAAAPRAPSASRRSSRR